MNRWRVVRVHRGRWHVERMNWGRWVPVAGYDTHSLAMISADRRARGHRRQSDYVLAGGDRT